MSARLPRYIESPSRTRARELTTGAVRVCKALRGLTDGHCVRAGLAEVALWLDDSPGDVSRWARAAYDLGWIRRAGGGYSLTAEAP